MSSLLIKSEHLLDLDLPFGTADILFDGDEILCVGRDLPETAGDVIDATGRVVMPGLINAHTHSGQILERDLADNCPLDLWLLHAAMGGRQFSEEQLYVLTSWSVLVQLKTGCTACREHVGVRPDRFGQASDAVMQAYVDSGFRAAVAPSVGDMDFFRTLPIHLLEGEEPSTLGRTIPAAAMLLAETRRFLQTWQGRNARVQPCIGPGAPQRCSDALLTGCFQLPEEFDAGVHTHLLAARSQWFACQNRFGGSPLNYFQRMGWMSPRLSCAHGVWLSESEAEILSENGSCVSHNPVSNLRLGSGVFNLQMAIAKGAPVALDADGAASNDNQNMWEVLKLTALLHNLYGKQEQWIDAAAALRLCWDGGAKILLQEVGAIRPGYQADLVILGGPELFLRDKQQMIPSLVYGELGQSVETAIVAGRVLLCDRKPVMLNEARLHNAAADIVIKGVEQMPERELAYAAKKGYIERMLSACECLDGPPARFA